MNEELNKTSLDTICASLTYAMGIDPPAAAEKPNEALVSMIDSSLPGKKADRIFMFNPDAIPQWILRKYPLLFKGLGDNEDFLHVPLRTVMPSVTPVCFGTMYTGAQPSVHGIQKYEKPVIKLDSIFDAMIRAGKKAIILATTNCSMSKIFLERDMDYFIGRNINEVNAKCAELIIKDEYDFIALYNGNYDSVMHKFGPESVEALGELRANVETFLMYNVMIREHWKKHDTFIGFAMDHGAHAIDNHDEENSKLGSHGLDMPEDLNITHFYTVKPAEAE